MDDEDKRLRRTIVLRNIGIPFVVAAFILMVRIIYEKTYLTYVNGPQMIGFSFMHSGLGALVIMMFYVSLLWGLIAFLLTFVVGAVYITKLNSVMIGVVLLSFIVILSPDEWWQDAIRKFSSLNSTTQFVYEKKSNQLLNPAWPIRPCSDLNRCAASSG